MTLYDSIGRGYAAYRRPDPRIAAAIDAALGAARSVVNVGAGTGSYEPVGRDVIAVEPSEVMIRQRAAGAAPCRQGTADALPLESKSVDAAMAILSGHHWPSLEGGLREMARAARERVVMLTWVPDGPAFWLTAEYFPEIYAHDCTIFPDTATLRGLLERNVAPARIEPMMVPHDCADGFLCAYWRRPAMYLDEGRRGAISSFSRIDARAGVERLRMDLKSGRWEQKYGGLMKLNTVDAGYRIVVCEVG